MVVIPVQYFLSAMLMTVDFRIALVYRSVAALLVGFATGALTLAMLFVLRRRSTLQSKVAEAASVLTPVLDDMLVPAAIRRDLEKRERCARERPRAHLKGHGGPVEAVAAFRGAADALHVVTGATDKIAKVWDVAARRQITEMKGHRGRINAVAVSADGQVLLTGSSDRSAKIWDLTTGEELRTLYGHRGWIWAVAMTGDATTVVTGSDDGTAKVWRPLDSARPRTLRGHRGRVKAVAVAGSSVLTGGSDGTARLWTLSGEPVVVLQREGRSVDAVAVAADGAFAVTAGADGTVRGWDVARGAMTRSFTVGEPVRSLAVHSDGSVHRVATGVDSGEVAVWEPAGGRATRRIAAHRAQVGALAFSPDGSFIASGSCDASAKVWAV